MVPLVAPRPRRRRVLRRGSLGPHCIVANAWTPLSASVPLPPISGFWQILVLIWKIHNLS